MKDPEWSLVAEQMKKIRQTEELLGTPLNVYARLLAQENRQQFDALKSLRECYEVEAQSSPAMRAIDAIKRIAQEDQLQNNWLRLAHEESLNSITWRSAIEAVKSSALHRTLLEFAAPLHPLKELGILNIAQQQLVASRALGVLSSQINSQTLGIAQYFNSHVGQLDEVRRQLIQSQTNFSNLPISFRDILYSIQGATLNSRFDHSFLADVSSHMHAVQIAVEQENIENIETTTTELLRLVVEKIRKLAPNTISYDGMFNIVFAISLFLYQLDDSSKMEKRIIDQIKQKQAELLEAIESIRQVQPENLQSFCVIERTTRLHSRPSTKAASLATLYPNQRATIVQRKGKWVYVTYFDYVDGLPVSGWILKKYVKCIEVKKA